MCKNNETLNVQEMVYFHTSNIDWSNNLMHWINSFLPNHAIHPHFPSEHLFVIDPITLMYLVITTVRNQTLLDINTEIPDDMLVFWMKYATWTLVTLFWNIKCVSSNLYFMQFVKTIIFIVESGDTQPGEFRIIFYGHHSDGA